MDNPLVMQIVLGLIVLGALIFGGFSVKVWRAWHVVAGFLVFITACVFLVFLSMSLKARRYWLKQLDTHTKKYERLVAEQTHLMYGDLTQVDQQDDNLLTVSSKLNRILLDRGRVWRECTATPNGNSFTVTISGAAADKPHGIAKDFILYVFREADHESGVKIPITYVGEFKVTAATETTVDLQFTLPSPDLLAVGGNQAQYQQAIQNLTAGSTWALYEVMPVDDHRAFSDPESRFEVTAKVGEAVFGDTTEQAVTEVLNKVGEYALRPIDPQTYQNLVNLYTRDGKRATPSDPNSETFLKVEFVKPHEEKVDSETSLDVLTSRYFDAAGQAQIGFLQEGEGGTIKLPAGTIALLPYDDGNRLINSGVCNLIEPIYVRPLNDFGYLFHNLFDRWAATSRQNRRRQQNLASLDETRKKVENVILQRQDELAKETSDFNNIKEEQKRVTDLADRMAGELQTLRAKLGDLFRANLALERDLAEIERVIIERVERSVREAVAMP